MYGIRGMGWSAGLLSAVTLELNIRDSMNDKRIKDTERRENSAEITLQDVRSRTQTGIEDAIQSETPVLVDAPPGAGKTTPIPQIANQTGTPLTHLTQRTDLYDQMEGLCQDAGVSIAKIPSPHRDCPTFNGDHGSQWKDDVEEFDD